MKPPPKQPGPEDDRRHLQLGRIVRRGLERTYGAAPEPSSAESLYRQAVRAGGPPGRAWPIVLGGFGAACAAAALILAWMEPADDASLVWVSDGATGAGAVASSAPAIVGSLTAARPRAAESLRFSDGSVVTFRPGSAGRILATTARGASVAIDDGRAHLRLAARPGAAWQIQAGPYTLEATAGELEAAWTPRQEILSVGLFAGKLVVRGPGAADGKTLNPGESLVGRPRDGVVLAGRGRALQAALSQEEVGEGVGAALIATAGEDDGSKPGAGDGTQLPPVGVDENGICAQPEPIGAAAVPDPGPVSLLTCRHVDPGPTGKDVIARAAADSWVRPGPSGCLIYQEDARGNRVPDFSHAGYRGGGIPLPANTAGTGVSPLLPSATGDDTANIQAAVDAVGALPIDSQGHRGVVELGPGVFTVKSTLIMNRGGVVLRGRGTEGPDATVLRAVGPARTVIRMGGHGKRRPGRDSYAITDVYVPVGARTFTVDRVGTLRVGSAITVYRPKTQRWICAIGTDVMPARTDGRANPPWRPSGSFSFERRITRIDGHRITVDAPLTNALEREYTKAFVTELEFPDRVSEIGIENLAARGDFAVSGCLSPRGRFIRADALVNGWIRNVRAENLGGEIVSLGSGSKWLTVEDATFVGGDDERCPSQLGFLVGGQQNLILRGRALGDHVTALMTETEIEGPSAVVDFVAVGKDVRVRVAPRWSTGLLFDNVRLQDGSGMPTGEIDLARAGATFGWSAANSVLWNSEAESLSVDSPPTAQNWILGGGRGARSLTGTGVFAAPRAVLQPQSLYRAQLVERLGRGALTALGRSPMGTLPGVVSGSEAPAHAQPFGSSQPGSAHPQR